MPPRPLKFPAKLSSVLRFLLPKKRPEDRMKIYREFVRGSLLLSKGIKPTDDEVAASINAIAEKKFQSIDQVNMLGAFLLRFAADYEAYNRKKRARAGALKRWGKKL